MKLIKKITPFILVLLVSLACFSCNDAKDEKMAEGAHYFYSLAFRESPYAPFKGIYPTTKEEAQSRNHYRLTYDKQGRLTELALMKNGKLVANNGNSAPNFFLGTSKIVFTYEEGKEKLIYFDFRDHQISFYTIYQAIYTLDDKGNRTSLEFFDDKNKPVASNWGITKYTWETDAEGRIKEQRFNLNGEQEMMRPNFDFYEVRMTYDDRGYLITLENYGKEGKGLTNNASGVAMDKLTYDEHGNFTKWEVFDQDKKPTVGNIPNTAGGRHEYNEYGDQIATETFGLDGKLMTASWNYARIDNEYKDGQRISFSYSDTIGNTVLNRNGGEKMSFKYNENNQTTKMYHVNKKGELTNAGDGIHGLYIKYDQEHFQEIERGFIDKDENLVNHPRAGYARITNKIDYEKNNRTRTFYDKDGKELRSRVIPGTH